VADIEEHPSWLALREELGGITAATGAANAYVLDAWGNLWCSARSVPENILQFAVRIAEFIVRTTKPPITRGGKLDQSVPTQGAVAGYIRSFSGVYILLVLSETRMDRGTIQVLRAIITRALPRIEALTLSLPPPDGPGPSSGEGFGVA